MSTENKESKKKKETKAENEKDEKKKDEGGGERELKAANRWSLPDYYKQKCFWKINSILWQCFATKCHQNSALKRCIKFRRFLNWGLQCFSFSFSSFDLPSESLKTMHTVVAVAAAGVVLTMSRALCYTTLYYLQFFPPFFFFP